MAILLINTDTGEPDRLVIAERAQLRACDEFGSSNPPPVYVRSAVRHYDDLALIARRRWRVEHGLPAHSVDDPLVMVEMPSWGYSGDSFGRGA